PVPARCETPWQMWCSFQRPFERTAQAGALPALRVALPSLGTTLSVRVAVRREAGGALREMLRRSGEMAYNKVYSRPEGASGRHSPRELWTRSSRTRRGQHPDDERDVLGGRGDDHERMEDLVRAEPPRPRIWPPARVDDCARGIEQAASGEQGQRPH